MLPNNHAPGCTWTPPATEAHARASDPETSHEAAERMRESNLESATLHALFDIGGGTTQGIADHLKVARDSISPRMVPLERSGLVRRTTRRIEGRVVWEVTALGEESLGR